MSAGSDIIIIEKVKQLIDGAPLSTLRHIVQFTSNLIVDIERTNARKVTITPNQLDDLFVYVPNFLKNSDTLDISTDLPSAPSEALTVTEAELIEELKSLGLEEIATASGATAKVQTQWILKNPEFNNLTAKPLGEFKAITKLCDLINEFEGTEGTMNGCLVNLYPTGYAQLSPHADDESYVNQESSICTLSLGCTRDFKILEKGHKSNTLLASYKLENQSLFLMQPGSQFCTRHQVLSDKTQTKDKLRYSISFRNIMPSFSTNEWPHTMNHSPILHPNPHDPKQSDHMLDTTIILGDSISRDLYSDKLAGQKNQHHVINLSRGGTKICDASTILDNFYINGHKNNPSPNCNTVKKVILCIGTNDIRDCRGEVNHMFYPFTQLIDKIRNYYPAALIYVQSLLPQKLVHSHIVDNVLNFLHLLQDACRAKNVYYIDVFHMFLNHRGFPDTSLFRPDGIHPNWYGRKILARAYIKVIRGGFDYYVPL